MQHSKALLARMALLTCMALWPASAGALTLDAPNGGVPVSSGSSFEVRWSDPGEAQYFTIQYTVNGGKTWRPIAARATGSSVTWNVPVVGRPKTNCRVRVVGFDSEYRRVAVDRSDTRFPIVVATVTEPNGGETYTPGQTVVLRWKTYATRRPVRDVILRYTPNGGRTWKTITKISGDNPGEYGWTVPPDAKTGRDYRIKVVLRDRRRRVLAADAGDEPFSVGTVEVREEAVPLSAETEQLLVAVSPDKSTLTFSGTNQELEGLQVGSVLVLGSTPLAPDGLLRKVLSFRTEGSLFIVETVQARLDEVIGEGTVSAFYTPSQGDLQGPYAEVNLEPGVYLVPGRPNSAMLAAGRAAGFLGSQLSYIKVIAKVLYSSGGAEVRVDGDFAFGLDFDLDVAITWTGLKRITFAVTPWQSAGLTFSATVERTLNEKILLGTLRYSPITFMVGPVPVVLVPTIQLYVGLDGRITANLTVSTVEEVRLTGGLTYRHDRDPKWQTYRDASVRFDYGIDYLVDGELRGYIRPEAQLLLYGLAGPYLYGEGYLRLYGQVLPELSYALYGGFEAGIGFVIDTWVLEKSYSAALYSKEWRLWPASSPPVPAGTQASDGTYSDRVRLTWGAADDAFVYQILRNTANTRTGAAELGSVTGTSTDDTSVLPELDYWYWVRAVNSVGASDYSLGDSGYRSVAAPATVIASDGTYADRVHVFWTAPTAADSYKVFRTESSALPAGAASPIGTPSVTSLDDTGAIPGKNYWYWVKSVGAHGDGGLSTGSTDSSGYRRISQPATLNATFDRTDGVRLTWPAAEGAAAYRLYRKTPGSGAPSGEAPIATPTGTTYDDVPPAAGTAYFYWISSLGQNGTESPQMTGPDTGMWVMLPPAALSATKGDFTDRVRLTWDPVPGAPSYKLYRNTTSETIGASLLDASASSPYDDATALEGIAYWYWVSASGPNSESGLSNSDEGWRALEAPTGLAASDGTYWDKVNVSWNAPAGATGYKIFRSASNDAGSAGLLGTSSLSEFADNSAALCVPYWYWVTATNPLSESAFSGSDSGWRTLAAPSNLSATDGTFVDRIQLTWSAVGEADSYRIFRHTANDSSAASEIGTSSTTAFEDTTAAAEVTYWYWVQATSAACDSRVSLSEVGYASVSICGNGVAEGPELCDGADVRGATCVGEGISFGGDLGCSPTCDGLDISTCNDCNDAYDCFDYGACLSGHCGPCTSTSDCTYPLQCFAGYCVLF